MDKNKHLKEMIITKHAEKIDALAKSGIEAIERIEIWKKLLDSVDFSNYFCWFFSDEKLYVETNGFEESWDLVSRIDDLFSCKVTKSMVPTALEPKWYWYVVLDKGASIVVSPAEPSEVCEPKQIKQETRYWVCEFK